MDHDKLTNLKSSHPTLRFLAADYFPLMASFFHSVFVKTNRRSIPQAELISSLDDYLFSLAKIHGETLYPRSATDYIHEWSGNSGYLRKYYTQNSDEPECDLTPETEKALTWLKNLNQNGDFVGTESRLITLFELMRELVRKTDPDLESRIQELQKQRDAIDEAIQNAKVGKIVHLDSTQAKERFYEIEKTAQAMLSDFRQIESNFRNLDRQTREKIAMSDQSKGRLLDEVFEERDVIGNSDQGRSFRGFWEFLISTPRQEEFDRLLQALYLRDEIKALIPDPFLLRVKIYLVEAGEKVYQTSNLLSEQLRKFLDDRSYLENRRIIELIRIIEKNAIDLKSEPSADLPQSTLDDVSPRLDLPMSRGLFLPAENPVISEERLLDGETIVSLDPLYQQTYVDERRLRDHIRKALQTHDQITLSRLIDIYPLQKGLAEIVAYLNIASRADLGANVDVTIEDEINDNITYAMPENEGLKVVSIPKIIFVRSNHA